MKTRENFRSSTEGFVSVTTSCQSFSKLSVPLDETKKPCRLNDRRRPIDWSQSTGKQTAMTPSAASGSWRHKRDSTSVLLDSLHWIHASRTNSDSRGRIRARHCRWNTPLLPQDNASRFSETFTTGRAPSKSSAAASMTKAWTFELRPDWKLVH